MCLLFWLDYIDTHELFGTAPLHSAELGETLSKIIIVAAAKKKFTPDMTYICNRMDIPAPSSQLIPTKKKSFSRGSSRRRVTQRTSNRWLSTVAIRSTVWKCFPNFLSTFVPFTKKSSASIASRMQSDLRRKDKNSSAPSTREVVVIYHISAFVFTLIIIFGIIIFFNGGVIIVVIVKHILFFALISS